MSTTTSLALQSLLLTAFTRTGLSRSVSRVTGLAGSARPLAAAAAAHRQKGTPVLFVLPADQDLDDAVDDTRFFLQALEGMTAADLERAVLPFPSLQVDPYRGLAPHFRATSARAQALHALATGHARVVVASAAALMPRLAPPAAVRALSMLIRPGQDIPPELFVEVLADGGYERQDPVDEHGEFCLRGGILDIFPAGESMPVRLEFVGDTVESLRRFDPDTQRSVDAVDQFLLVPVRDFAVTATSTSDETPGSILDYVGNAAVVIAEPSDVRAQVEQAFTNVRASFEERARANDASPSMLPPERLLLDWSGMAPLFARATLLEELGLDHEPTASPGTPAPATDQRPSAPGLHVAYQPPQEFKGRIPDWVADIRLALAREDTVLFVAGSRGRAERTVELLRDYDVRAAWAGHGSDQPAGAVLVADGQLSRGFRLAGAALTVYAAGDVFEEERRRGPQRQGKRSATAAFLSDLRDLKVGDLIVHVDHGIGQFVGLKQITVGDDVK
jgi:transcription-repair coupling factor (superfamily II helicase)